MNQRRPMYITVALASALLACIASSRDGHAKPQSSASDQALFAQLDRDGNGTLIASEIAEEHQRLFARLLRRGDANGDESLTRDEFRTGLTPSRPEKPLEAKQPAELPQADAVRYLLLTMDSDGDSQITANEVPRELRPAFSAMLERTDRNDNDVLERMELSRGGPQLARIAARFAERADIDIDAELRKLDKKLGAAARRFDQPRAPVDALRDPQVARELFARLDTNGDGQLSQNELPQQYQRGRAALMRRVDRNRDGQISEREFAAAAGRRAERMARMRSSTQNAPKP